MNSDVHIVLDFGDGSPKLRTREKKIVHQYAEHGLYKPRLSVCLGCEGNNIVHQEPVRILSYVEKPSGLGILASDSTLLGLSTSLKAHLKKGSFFNCTWDFGDQSSRVDTVYNGTKNHTVDHVYKAPSVYQGSVACFNRKARLSRSFEVDIQERIKDVTIHKIDPQSIEKQFQITWEAVQGAPIDYTVMVNGIEQAVTQNGKSGETIILPSLFEEKHGDYEIQVNVVNKVTETITITKMFSVFPVVTPVSIEVQKHTIEVNETLVFSIDSKNPSFKDYPQYKWNFGDTNKELSIGSKNETSHKYSIYGKVLVKLTSFNPISSQVSFAEIEVLRPVLQLEGLSCVAPPTPVGEKASMSCSLEMGSDFTCSIDWDGKGITRHNYTHLQYYTKQSTSKEKFMDLKFQDSFLFDQPNVYKVRTNCNNRLHQVTAETEIIVQDRVRDVTISPVDAQLFGNTFTISWQASGADVQYKIYWNGEELTDIRLVDGKPTTEINKNIYKNSGVHKFTLEAWNEISKAVRKDSNIIIEDELRDLSLNILYPQPENSFVEVNENVTVSFEVSFGSNPHYRITFIGVENLNLQEQKQEEPVVTTWNRYIRSFSFYGNMIATVTAYNNVSEVTISKQIIVLKPVLELGTIELKVPNENVSETVLITALLSRGSDLSCNVGFGDDLEQNTTQMYTSYYTSLEERDPKKYENIEIQFSHAYSQIKQFDFTITCTNRKGSTSTVHTISIFKPLVPFRISVPEMNEQNHPIGIEISKENDISLTKHEYEIDFGDSSEKVKTEQNKIGHTFKEFGQYTITVVAKSPVSTISIQQKIIILKPVIELKNLRLSSVPVNFTKPTPLSIRLRQGSDFKCTIQWNTTHKTTLDKSTDLVYYAGSDTSPFQDVFVQAQHIFPTEGHHKVAVTCSNRLGSLSEDITVITQIALKGFFIRPVLPQEFGKEFNIFYEIERGSELEIKCQFNGKPVDIVTKERRVLITPDLYITSGVYNITFTGSNLVSSAITRQETVVIDKRINDVTIKAEKTTLEVNETVTLNFGAIGGSSVLYDIDYNDGEGTGEQDMKDTQRVHHFKVQGEYTVTITAHNSISKEQFAIKITVLKPVLPLLGLTIEVPNKVNISFPYTLKLLLQQGSDFDCIIDYGNGNKDAISNQKTEYYTNEPRWSHRGFKDIVMTQKKAFPKVGEVTIEATCRNRRFEIKVQSTTNVYGPINDFNIITSKEIVEINETISMQVEGLEGVTSPLLRVESGKYGSELTTSEVSFENSFSHHGEFSVTVNASNPTSSALRRITIKVLKPVLALDSLSASVEPTNLTDEALLVVNMTKGSDFKCKVTWGDSQDPESHTFEEKYSFYKDLSIDESPFTNIQMKFKHRYVDIGKYSASIDCENRKSKISTQTEIVVQTPITGFKLLEVLPQRFGSTFQLKWVTDGGSNIEFTILWEGVSKTYQRSASTDREIFVTVIPDDYTDARMHNFTICAKNKVSNARNLTSRVIIERELNGLKIEPSKTQEVEVNETITVSANVASGNNPHFKYNSGDGVASEELLTTDYPLSYKKQGTYKVKVQARNNVSRVEAEALVTVIKPALPITKVLLNTKTAYDTNKTTEIYVIVRSGSDFKCLIMYGDGSQEMSGAMNTEYYQDGRKGDLNKYKNTKLVFYHNYTLGDAYNVQVTCSNRISSQSGKGIVFVQSKIDGLHISPIKPKKVGEKFDVEFIAVKGTNLTFFVHFQGKVYRHHTDLPELRSQILSSEVAGVFRILINATNYITGTIVQKMDVIVEEPITDLQIHSPVKDTDLEVGEEFEFCYSIKQGTDSKFAFKFDGSLIKVEAVKIKAKLVAGAYQFCFKHTFDNHPNFTKGDAQLELGLTLTAKNNVTDLTKRVQIVLLKPVLAISMHSLYCNATETSTQSQPLLTVSGSDLICNWKIESKDDVAVSLDHVFHKNGASKDSSFKNLEVSQSTTFKSPGAYRVSITCSNRKGSESLSTVCLVQDAITGIKVEEIGSVEFGESHDIVWFEKTGTNITYTGNINGISFTDIQMNSDGKNFMSLPDDIVSKPGDYKGEVIASNLITKDLVTTFSIRFEKRLTIKDVLVTYQDGKTGKADKTGHGDGTYYPVRKDVTFSIKTNAEVFDTEWIITKEEEKNTTELTVLNQKSFMHLFKENGVRTIKYHVSNNISHAEGEMVLNFIEAAGPVTLTSNTPQWIGYGMNFTVLMPDKGQETCFRFDAGDGTVYYYTTEKGDCTEFYPELLSSTKKNTTSGIFPKYQDSLLIFHNYSTWNFYTATVTAVNHLSRQNSTTQVLASQVICNFPTTNITNLGVSPFYPTRLSRSEKMTVYLDAEINCAFISKAKYEWSIFKYNQVNGKLTPVLLDNKTYSFDPYNQKDLIIKKKSLPYGVYLIKSIVTMDDPKALVFRTPQRGYLQIYPSNLVAAVEGGALIRRGIGNPIPFSGAASCDPDINKNNFTGKDFFLLYHLIVYNCV